MFSPFALCTGLCQNCHGNAKPNLLVNAVHAHSLPECRSHVVTMLHRSFVKEQDREAARVLVHAVFGNDDVEEPHRHQHEVEEVKNPEGSGEE